MNIQHEMKNCQWCEGGSAMISFVGDMFNLILGKEEREITI